MPRILSYFSPRILSTLLIVLALGFTSCEEDEDYYLGQPVVPEQPTTPDNPGSGNSGSDNSGGTNDNGSSGNTDASKADVLGRLELPAPLAGNDFLVHRTSVGGRQIVNYMIEYNRATYHSRWVAFRFDAQTRPKAVGRKDYSIKPQYPHDPLLPSSVGLADDVSFNGYDHGHLVASADRLFSREGNDQTFYMTNMSPMISRFNQKYWVTLEQYVQGKGRDASFADTLYVVKGGTITADKVLKRVASNRIVVPKFYYMALLKVKNGAYSALGLWVEHKDYCSSYAPTSVLGTHAVSIDSLETLTGIDFFHNLPDQIETAVEKTAYTSAWGIN